MVGDDYFQNNVNGSIGNFNMVILSNKILGRNSMYILSLKVNEFKFILKEFQ